MTPELKQLLMDIRAYLEVRGLETEWDIRLWDRINGALDCGKPGCIGCHCRA